MELQALHERFDKAHRIIREAGAYLLSHASLRREILTKAENDYVTVADRECERLIDEALTSSFPEDALFGEENGKRGRSRNRWIIDPIDGTVNFMTGFPNFTISIAFEDEEGLAFGLVLVVAQNELFSGFRGKGAYLNGEKIQTDEITSTHKQLALLVPPHRHHEHMERYMPIMRRFYDTFSDMRSIGSAALSLCYVASGRCQAYYELGLSLYDVAAAIVILTEAGGRVTLLTKDERWLEVVGTASFCHREVLEIIDGKSSNL